MENKALRNHVIKSLQEIDVDNCELQCYLEPNCVSYNHGPSLCELNNMTHLQAPLDDMEARHGSTYRAIFYVSNMVEPGVLYHIGSIQTTFEFYYWFFSWLFTFIYFIYFSIYYHIISTESLSEWSMSKWRNLPNRIWKSWIPMCLRQWFSRG